MKAVFLREMASYFIAPAGYVYLAAFYCLAGYEYSVLILNGQAEMSYEFTFLYTVTLLLTPVLTMRLMSEDRKQKTDQMLFAAPVSLGGIVAGKYMAAVVVFLGNRSHNSSCFCSRTFFRNQLGDILGKSGRTFCNGNGGDCFVYVYFSPDGKPDYRCYRRICMYAGSHFPEFSCCGSTVSCLAGTALQYFILRSLL